MTFKNRSLGVMALLLAAGCSNSSESDSPKTAGGQSGTDANGGYQCSAWFEQAEGDPLQLDEPASPTELSPNDAYDIVEGDHTFSCDRGADYTVSVQRGAAARSALGLLNENLPDELCRAMQLDATVHLEAADGSVSHDSTFVASEGKGARYTIGKHGVDADGHELWFVLDADPAASGERQISRLSIFKDDNTMTRCSIPTEPGGAGGHDG